MKNQQQLTPKKPPTRIQSQINIFNKKDTISPQFQTKRKNVENDNSLKKRSIISPKNVIQNKLQIKKQLSDLNVSPKQLTKNKSVQFKLTKRKSNSQYQPALKFGDQILQKEELKIKITFYKEKNHVLQQKVSELQLQIQQKKNALKYYSNKQIQLMHLKQQILSYKLRQRLINQQKKVLLQKEKKNQKKISKLELQIITQKDLLKNVKAKIIESYKSIKINLKVPNVNLTFLYGKNKAFERYSQIIKQKQNQIKLFIDQQDVYKEKMSQLQKQLQKQISLRPLFAFDYQKKILHNQIFNLHYELSSLKCNTSNPENQQKIKYLSKEVENNSHQILTLLKKNQQFKKQILSKDKQFEDLKIKYSQLQQLNAEQSTKLLLLTSKCSKLQEQHFLKISNNQSSMIKSIQITNKIKNEDPQKQIRSQSIYIQKLQTLNKNLQNSLIGFQQNEKKLKDTQILLQQSNKSLMKIKLQIINNILQNQRTQ